MANYKSLSKIDLAEAYGVSPHTITAWIKPIEKHVGDYVARCYTPKQVQKIVELLGEPQNIKSIRD